MDLESLKYPIGKFKGQSMYSLDYTRDRTSEIKALPNALEDVVSGLSESQLNTAYRPGGWTVRQLVHHIADSHINSYVRFRWTLTEEAPIIKAYDEKSWAELPDASAAPVSLSLDLLRSLHSRWSYLMDNMTVADFDRTLAHPAWEKDLSLHLMADLYAWHGKHHLTHITSLIEREGW